MVELHSSVVIDYVIIAEKSADLVNVNVFTTIGYLCEESFALNLAYCTLQSLLLVSTSDTSESLSFHIKHIGLSTKAPLMGFLLARTYAGKVGVLRTFFLFYLDTIAHTTAVHNDFLFW